MMTAKGQSSNARSWKQGACHCATVRFEAELEDCVTAEECNCSMCHRIGFLHLIVPKSRFRLLAGADNLTVYTFNTGVAQHSFCKICGVKPFYIPRSNPDGYSVNLRCMDSVQFTKIDIVPFDGQHWEENAGRLAHLSRE